MQKAFLFDMDGVIIDSERVWGTIEANLMTGMFGKEIYTALKKTGLTGSNLNSIHAQAVKLGATIPREEYLGRFNEAAQYVYRHAPLTEGIEEFAKELLKQNFKLGLVSASPLNWIEMMFKKMSIRDSFTCVISLHERNDLQPKPAPDGYREAMNIIQAPPSKTLVLEDSRHGINAGLAAGAFTICLRQNWPDGYEAKGADLYVDSLPSLREKINSII